MTKNQVTVVTSGIAAVSAIVVAAFGWYGTHPSQPESAGDERAGCRLPARISAGR